MMRQFKLFMDRRTFIIKGTGLGILGGLSLMGLAQEPKEKAKKYTVITQRCDGCGHCFRSCREQALIVKEGKVSIDDNKCRGCGDCTRFCKRMAIVAVDEK
jgi:MinD superfamily P-loop ATPase